ncbi:MAG: DUF3800 domain-containing protein [Lentisphaeria bacterium]|nr:DUF3800 domain-containing protein [Lentisphaeria bacterium]
MWWLYLDESGDLGFDFVNKKPSNFFTICILATSQKSTDIAFGRAVKRTLKNKLNAGAHKKRMVPELKGSASRLSIKKYAWKHIEDETFGIYCITLNKRRVYPRLAEQKSHVYNYVARMVIDQIPFEKATGSVRMVIDRSKGKRQVWEFNEYIERQLQGRISPDVELEFKHGDSQNWAGLQWADLFAWGVFRKYEQGDSEWYDVFQSKVLYDEQYL